MKNVLVWVDISFACFGFETDGRGTIIAVAPIGGWMAGRDGAEMVRYWKKRGGKIEILPLV